MNLSADIVIVGGGIVGATTAALMAGHGYSVVLLEKKTPTFDGIEKLHPRVSAITPRAARVLGDLKLWETIPVYHRTPFEHMVVWDATETSKGKVVFDAATAGEPCLGTIVNNNALLKALWDHVSTLSHVSILRNDSCIEMASKENKTVIKTKNGHKITGALVVGADGARSWVREAANFTLQEKAYDHNAIVAVVMTEEPHQETAWQRFLPHGPLAFLPLSAPTSEAQSNYYSAIVWSTHPTKAKNLIALEERDFCDACGIAFDFTLGKIIHCKERLMFPLSRRHATYYVKPGIALVGDAAHTLHPLAGQGVNLGIYDALALTDVVKKAHDKKRDFASYYTLRAYERQRKTHNTVMLASMDGLKGLFGNGQSFVGDLRRRGLRELDRWPAIKNWIIHYALG